MKRVKLLSSIFMLMMAVACSKDETTSATINPKPETGDKDPVATSWTINGAQMPSNNIDMRQGEYITLSNTSEGDLTQEWIIPEGVLLLEGDYALENPDVGYDAYIGDTETLRKAESVALYVKDISTKEVVLRSYFPTATYARYEDNGVEITKIATLQEDGTYAIDVPFDLNVTDAAKIFWSLSTPLDNINPIVIAEGDKIEFTDESRFALTHLWSMPSTNPAGADTNSYLAPAPGTVGDDVYPVTFNGYGDFKVNLRNTYSSYVKTLDYDLRQVYETVEIDGENVYEKNFDVRVYKKVLEPMARIYLDAACTQEAVPAADNSISLEYGSSLYFKDITAGWPNFFAWESPSANIARQEGTDLSVVELNFSKLSEGENADGFVVSQSVERRADASNAYIPAAALATADVPLKIKVTPSLNPVILESNMFDTASAIADSPKYQIRLKYNSPIDETKVTAAANSEFGLAVTNTYNGQNFSANYSPSEVSVDLNDKHYLVLTFTQKLYNTDDMVLSYNGSTIATGDGRKIDPIAAQNVETDFVENFLPNMLDASSWEIPSTVSFEVINSADIPTDVPAPLATITLDSQVLKLTNTVTNSHLATALDKMFDAPAGDYTFIMEYFGVLDQASQDRATANKQYINTYSMNITGETALKAPVDNSFYSEAGTSILWHNSASFFNTTNNPAPKTIAWSVITENEAAAAPDTITGVKGSEDRRFVINFASFTGVWYVNKMIFTNGVPRPIETIE